MALEHELALPTARAGAFDRAAIKRRLLGMTRLARAYRALLLDSEGELTANAALVLQDLAHKAHMGMTTPGASEAQLREREGARMIVLHIMAKIDPAALRKLAAKMRENDE